MSESTSTYADELRRKLHGEQVGTPYSLVCDFCSTEIDIAEPVMYDALRVVDMPNLETLINPPKEWILDAARCRACESESVDPATDGYDEALILLSINESNDILSADTSNMTVVDVSPHEEGYYPPVIDPNLLIKSDDAGFARWIRMIGILDDSRSNNYPQLVEESIETMIRHSREVPPDVNL